MKYFQSSFQMDAIAKALVERYKDRPLKELFEEVAEAVIQFRRTVEAETRTRITDENWLQESFNRATMDLALHPEWNKKYGDRIH